MNADRQSGFTLLETLVALVVLALAVAGVQLCLSTGWRGVRLVNQEKAALYLAKAQLAAAGVETPLQEGTWDGEVEPGLVWTREIRRYQDASGSGRADVDVANTGYWVSVVVRWQERPRQPERSLSLQTLKIGRGG